MNKEHVLIEAGSELQWVEMGSNHTAIKATFETGRGNLGGKESLIYIVHHKNDDNNGS